MSRLKSFLVGSVLAVSVVAAPVTVAMAAQHDSAPAATQMSAMPCMSCWG